MPARSPRRSRARSPRTVPLLIGHVAAARLLDLSPLTIRLPEFRARHGIPFVKVGALVKYEEGALREYVARHRVNGHSAAEASA
jgi:hypothetical protein